MTTNNNLPELYVKSIELSLQFYVNGLGFKIIYLNEDNSLARIEYGVEKITLKQIFDIKNNIKNKNKELLTFYSGNIDFLFSYVKRIKLNNVKEMFIDYYKTQNDEYIEKSFKVTDPDGYNLRFYKKINLSN